MSLRAVFEQEKAQRIRNVMPDELLVYKVVRLYHTQDPNLLDSIKFIRDRVHENKTVIPPAILKNIEDLMRASTRYISPVCGFKYNGGEQTNQWNSGRFDVPLADQPEQGSSYYPGFHSFATRAAGERFLERQPGESCLLLTCGVLKEWITAIGIENERDMVIVSNRILMPAYPHTDIRNDKNCAWFFEAQSKERAITSNAIVNDSTAGIQPLYREEKKRKRS